MFESEIKKLIQDDWLNAAALLAGESVHMVYADLPFNTGVRQQTPPNAKKRVKATESTSYADSWPTPRAYVEWLRERLEATLPALKPSATMLLHCDWRVCHHVRVLLDELLGADRFVNHLIWHYGLGGSSPRTFARKHDDILFYCLNPKKYYFEPPRVPATSQKLRGLSKKATDVLDIASINNMASERTGYPTQKPLALLELLVRACCPAGGVVLDPCCGSGTTLVAAERLGRGWIGFDSNPDAIKIARKRLEGVNRRESGETCAG